MNGGEMRVADIWRRILMLSFASISELVNDSRFVVEHSRKLIYKSLSWSLG